MYSRRCLATTLTTVLVIGALVLLIANSVNLLVFDIIGAQENSPDTNIVNKTGTDICLAVNPKPRLCISKSGNRDHR